MPTKRTKEVESAFRAIDSAKFWPHPKTIAAYARELEKLNSARVSERDRFMRKAKESRLRAEAAEKRVKELEARLSDEIWWAGEKQKIIDLLRDALKGAVPFDHAAKEKIDAALRAKGGES